MKAIITLLLGAFLMVNCQSEPKNNMAENSKSPEGLNYLKAGKIEVFNPQVLNLIDSSSNLEILATGHEWTEGPLWVPSENMLLYCDIPRNAIYKWTADGSSEIYLEKSGFSGEDFSGKEPGSNGLVLDENGNLVMCQHGNRQMARMNAPLASPAATFDVLTDKFEGKRFNSPNDAVYKSNGDLYFTDPPYGLPKQMDDPEKEIDYQGVYMLDQEGVVHVLTPYLTRPNGIAFSRDEKKLYVANSDPNRAIWMVYDVIDNGYINGGLVLYDVTDQVSNYKGLPDGMKVHSSGNVFATGPGGVYVFSPSGEKLALIHTGEATSNCAFDEDENYLYITADSYVLRLPMK